MQTAHSQITRLSIELDTVPLAFRCAFVLFLLIVALLMRKDDKEGIGKIND